MTPGNTPRQHDDGAFCYRIGADENGLGPQLGPMIVTAVMARVARGKERIVTQKPRGHLAKRLGDSKGLVSHGNIGLGEAWTRVLVERGAGNARNATAKSPADLVQSVSLDDHAELTQPCPSHVEAQCWSVQDEQFEPGDAVKKTMGQLQRDLDRLEQRGLEVVAVRSVIVCTRRLNQAAERGQSRFVVDLNAMERLIVALRDMAGTDVDAECGKVGGFGKYGKAFGPLGGRLHVVLEEGRARSAYRFAGIGDIAFVRDCDDSNILVGMASLVGKYLRELLMARIVRHYRQQDDRLPAASGYHDPVTGKFVLTTESLRRKARVPDSCFLRQRVQNADG